MSERAEALSARRERLQEQIARDRAALAQGAGELRRPLHVLERVRRRAEFVHAHRAWLLLPLLGVALLFPRRALRFAAVLIAARRALLRPRPAALPAPGVPSPGFATLHPGYDIPVGRVQVGGNRLPAPDA